MKNIRTLLVIIVLMFSFTALNASMNPGSDNPLTKSALKGQVMDLSSGETLAGVAVKIEGTELSTYTDLDGQFEIKGLKPGKYNIICTFISYKNSLVENIELKAGEAQKLEIQLQASK